MISICHAQAQREFSVIWLGAYVCVCLNVKLLLKYGCGLFIHFVFVDLKSEAPLWKWVYPNQLWVDPVEVKSSPNTQSWRPWEQSSDSMVTTGC